MLVGFSYLHCAFGKLEKNCLSSGTAAFRLSAERKTSHFEIVSSVVGKFKLMLKKGIKVQYGTSWNRFLTKKGRFKQQNQEQCADIEIINLGGPSN